jgi:hypothetical protein
VTPAGFVMHAPVSPGQQAAAWVVAITLALALKAWLAWRLGPRRRHLRATRRNGVMLARPPIGTGYQRRW